MRQGMLITEWGVRNAERTEGPVPSVGSVRTEVCDALHSVPGSLHSALPTPHFDQFLFATDIDGRYAGAFAARFPWVRFYTPVNEIYVCAKLSTLEGLWNEAKKGDDRAFVTALKHLCRANLLAIREISQVRPDAIFIQSESAEYFH